MVTDKREGLESTLTTEPPDTPREEPKENPIVTGLLEVIETVLLGLLIFFLLRSAVQNFRVEGNSMEPTLHNGQHILINKAVYLHLDDWKLTQRLPFAEGRPGEHRYLFHPPERGEIVIFRFPQDPRRDFIKRVIALPGETVEIRQGQVYINGQVLSERYVANHQAQDVPPLQVPEGQYFVLGDNRDNSSDSRTWGTVPAGNILGRAWVSYWPTERWGVVPNSSPAAAGPLAAGLGWLTRPFDWLRTTPLVAILSGL